MIKRWIAIIINAGVLFFITSGVFGAGVLYGRAGVSFAPAVAQARDQPPEFEVFWQVWSLVYRYYVDQATLKPTRLTYGAIKGLVEALGDEGHTRFLPPEEVEQHQTENSGRYDGVGVQVGLKDDRPVVTASLAGSPADQAGVKVGDIIRAIDGQDVAPLSLFEVVDRIRGETGTAVTLSLFRPDTAETLEFSLKRAKIKIEAATWAMVPGTKVALIQMAQFSENLTEEVIKAINEAQVAGATALILDVRNNPGGLLQQAVTVTSQFLKDGSVLLQEDAAGQRETFAVEPGGVAPDIPLVVLVNRGSASSAEILAGAIQDHRRGTLIGETTFGAGTVLQPFPLADGSLLLLGASQWLTPNGRHIRQQGIKPDIVVELAATSELITPAKLKEMSVTQLLASQDKQLLKALEVLAALNHTSFPSPH